MQDNDTTLAPTAANELATAQAYEQAVGQAANEAAKRHVFEDYKSRKAANTLQAHRSDLGTFCTYLDATGIQRDADQLQENPSEWAFVTFGHVKAFVQWMLKEGYAIASVNRKLNTVKVYAKQAFIADCVDGNEQARIAMVQGYSDKAGRNANEKREVKRKSSQKSTHTALTVEEANALKFNPNTPQGRRDTVLMCLLLDHGLRASEVSSLQIDDFDMESKQFTFYRQKVDKTQTHNMSRHTFEAVEAYMDAGDAPTTGRLLRGSRKGGRLTDDGMNRFAISKRVRKLGEEIGIEKLSAHDCRHYWATRAVSAGTDAFALRDAGGWSSLAMPSRYVEAATVANERVRL